MRKYIRFTLVLTLVLALSACNFPFFTPPEGPSVVRLAVEAQNSTGPFNTPGQVINYTYAVTNTGNSRLAGPVIVTDAQRQISCPDVNTVGNQDGFLDLNESITCRSEEHTSELQSRLHLVCRLLLEKKKKKKKNKQIYN